MAHVRKVAHPSGKTAWRATIATAEGKRRSKNFPLKAEAIAWVRQNDGASATGTATMTFSDLARNHNRWFAGLVEAGERGQRTADGYDSHLRIHLLVDALLANAKLSELDTPMLQGFLDRLIARRGSVELARRVRKSISAWCEHGKRNGWLRGDPLDACKVVEKRKRKASARLSIPPKSDLSALITAAPAGPAPARDNAIIHLLAFAGLRISELLGLADDAVELRRPGHDGKGGGGTVFVRERLCSRHVTLGEVKSEDGFREVPIGPAAAAAIRAWRVARGAPPAVTVQGVRKPGRLFPAPHGTSFLPLWGYQAWRRDCWWPLMQRAGLGVIEADTKGVRRPRAAFGPHTMRHVYASIQIENKVTPKRLQELMGHATLAMTMDLYGHLWTDPAGDQAMAEAAELAIPKLA